MVQHFHSCLPRGVFLSRSFYFGCQTALFKSFWYAEHKAFPRNSNLITHCLLLTYSSSQLRCSRHTLLCLPYPALYFFKLPSVLFSSGLLQLKWIPRLDISGHPATISTTHAPFLFPFPSLIFTPAHRLVPGQPSSVRLGQGSGAGNLTMAELWQVNSTPAVKLTSVPAELTRHPVSKG